MALLGVLSLGQIVFLPGYLLLRALRVRTGILGTCILSFALSLVINHVLVAGLVVLGVYRPAVVYAVFTVELALLLAGDRRWLQTGLGEAVAACRRRMLAFFRAVQNDGIPSNDGWHVPELAKGVEAGRPRPSQAQGRATHRLEDSLLHPAYEEPIALRRALVAAAVLVIGGFALSGIAQTGRIFQQWDAVVSWNRWAVDWAANRLPRATGLYPQLLPANLSLTYVFMQSSEVWIFAKAFQFLFCLMLLLAMLDLARIEGKFGYVPGVVITYGLLVALLRFRMLSSGYADVPLAFVALASVYALLRARRTTDPREREKYLMAGALLAAGAAATKQIGLYIAAIHPLLAWRFVLQGDGPPALRRHLPALLRTCSIICILVLPWYLYKFFDFQAGCDSDNTALLVTDFHQGRDLLQRLVHAGNTVVAAITPLGAVLLLIAVAASLRDPLQRWLVGILVVPLGLLWAAAFSYDLRNLASIVPWVGAAAGIGAMQILSWVARLEPSSSALHPPNDEKCVSQAGVLRVGHVVAISVLLLIAVCPCLSNEMLLNWQQRQQRLAGVPELNGQLYAYAASHPGGATIATDYQAMRWLPDLGQRSIVCTCHELSAFRQTFDRPEVRYVLVRTQGAAAEVREFLEDRTAAQLLFESHGFAFYEKRPGERAKVAAIP